MDYDSLLNSIRKILIKYYRQKITKLKFSNEDFLVKSHKTKKYTQIIQKLMQGELVYESDSTF